MTRTSLLTRAAFAVALASGFAATTAQAQSSPTMAGTVINNQASAAYNDARGNAYTVNSAVVSLTVALRGAPSITVDPGAAPTYSNTIGARQTTFTITNLANGADFFNITAITPGGTVAPTITGYTVVIDADGSGGNAPTGAQSFQTAAEVDDYVDGFTIQRNGTVTIAVGYTNGQGSGNIALTAESGNNADTASGYTGWTETATHSFVFNSNLNNVHTVDVTLVAPTTRTVMEGETVWVSFLVNNTGVSASYTVAINNNAVAANNPDGVAYPSFVVSGSYVLAANDQDMAVRPTNQTGVLNTGQSATIWVRFTVKPNTPSSVVGNYVNSIRLRATNTTTNADPGSTLTDAEGYQVNVTAAVARNAVTITKAAFVDNAGAPGNSAPTVLFPNTVFWYKITVDVANNPSANGEAATGVVVTDVVPAQLTINSASSVGTGAGNTDEDITPGSGQTVTKTYTTIAAGGQRVIWIKVTVK